MTTEPGILPAQHIAKLEQLIAEGQTGLLTMSFDGKIAVFSLENGEIGYIFFRGKKGLAALSLLCDELMGQPLGAIRVGFDSVPVAGKEPFLPITETVLNRLKVSNQQTLQNDIVTDTGNLAPIPGVLLNTDIEKGVQSALEDLIGPLAFPVCAEVFRATRTLRVAVETLANELPDGELGKEFKRLVRIKLADVDPSQFTFGADVLTKAEVTASAKIGIPLTEEVKDLIGSILPLFMGPRANAICQEVFARTTTLRAAIDHITTEISTPLAAEQFKETMRKRLPRLSIVKG